MSRNPTRCGVCGVWITGLWAHEARSKSHKQKLALIKQRNKANSNLDKLIIQDKSGELTINPEQWPTNNANSSPARL